MLLHLFSHLDLLLIFLIPAPPQSVYCRHHYKSKNSGTHHTADHGSCNTFHNFRTGAVAPHYGHEPRHNGDNGHHLGPDPQSRPFLYGLVEVLTIELLTVFAFKLLVRKVQVDQHDHTSLSRNSCQGLKMRLRMAWDSTDPQSRDTRI